MTNPRIFHIPVIDITAPDHFKGSIKAQIKGGDARDSILYVDSGVGIKPGFIFESLHGYWLPLNVNDARLTRGIYMMINKQESKISFLADCLPVSVPEHARGVSAAICLQPARRGRRTKPTNRSSTTSGTRERQRRRYGRQPRVDKSVSFFQQLERSREL